MDLIAQWLNQIGLEFVLTREYLKAGVFVSLLSVWVLVSLFFYLNYYTKRRYFTIWTAAWLFYALWITLSFGVPVDHKAPLVLMLQQSCVGISAAFLLWGSMLVLDEKLRPAPFGGFIAFLVIWSYYGAFHLRQPLQMEVPVFTLIAIASAMNAFSFFRYRRRTSFRGATLLAAGFVLWGLYMAAYPFLENSLELTSVALFISAGLQLLLAVSMIILVLEEVRETNQQVEKKAEEGRREREVLKTRVVSTEERYKKLFELASEAIVITSADDFRILELNQAAERLLGLSHSEMGRHCLTAFCQVKPVDRSQPGGSEAWFNLVCRQRPLNLARKNGALVPVEINGTMIEFDGRRACQFFILELTERARLEQQLRQAEKLSAIGQMISGIAHELNNPLSVVKGYLELVLSHHDLSHRTRADLERASQESSRAAKIVMNFLTFAREQPAPRELVALNELARRIVELRQFDLEAAQCEVSLDLDPLTPMVMADPDQIHQLMVNLMNNSFQAMSGMATPKRMRIQTLINGDHARLVVEDAGPGVPAHLVNRIFEPFFTTKDVGSGTGLGLSIAHSIMTEHKGRIIYESASLGGAGFILEFPLAEGRRDPENDVSTTTLVNSSLKSARKHFGKILVLDDEPAIADMLGEMLELLGFTPTVCHAASRALELLKSMDFDLIISDFRMPEINGQQFHAEVARTKPGQADRIIFLTGDVVNEETQAFLRSIGNPHIAKPFNLRIVETIVVQTIEERRSGKPEPAIRVD